MIKVSYFASCWPRDVILELFGAVPTVGLTAPKYVKSKFAFLNATPGGIEGNGKCSTLLMPLKYYAFYN